MFDLKEDNYRKISEKKLKVLLIQRGEAPYEGCYALPGGFVHPEETIYKAAERELKEETNLNCNFLEQFGVYSNPGRDPRRWVISNGLMALMNGGQEVIQAGDDASDAKWFDVSFEKKQENCFFLKKQLQVIKQYSNIIMDWICGKRKMDLR